jgi:3-isopropylmalate/(R)-2-methylmalate dehydratase large subunit
MSGQTYFDKVWADHVIRRLDERTDLLQIDRLILHELGGSQALHALDRAGRRPDSKAQIFTIIEHLISTRPGRGPTDSPSPSGFSMISTTRAEARRWDLNLIDYDDARQGIAHVVAPELGIALPGTTLVCCDSHTCTVGGIGAIAWGIGVSEAEHVIATQTLVQTRPANMRARFDGRLPEGVYAKDMILALIAKLGAAAGIGYAVEFSGEAVRALPVEARLTLCNMSIEFQAKYGFVPPDDTTLHYLAGRERAPQGEAWDSACRYWRALQTDADAVFDREVSIDCSSLEPQVSWGISPQHTSGISHCVPSPDDAGDGEARDLAQRALDYMQLSPGTPLQGIPIDAVYIGSCTNARLSDLRAAAEVLKGRKVKPGVQAVCVPGSTSVRDAARAEGLDRVFIEAGFEWHESGCGYCGHLGDNRFANQRVVSTTNRNFEGRQGPRTRTHLASPATVAASAVAGCIADARPLLTR